MNLSSHPLHPPITWRWHLSRCLRRRGSYTSASSPRSPTRTRPVHASSLSCLSETLPRRTVRARLRSPSTICGARVARPASRLSVSSTQSTSASLSLSSDPSAVVGCSEPFVSLFRIFLACELSPLEGLLRFGLERPGYDSGLGGIAPFKDIWVPLATARRVAQELDVLVELAALLEWETRTAWSVEDREVGGIVHKYGVLLDVDWSRTDVPRAVGESRPIGSILLHTVPKRC
jgi:hypothetical protein